MWDKKQESQYDFWENQFDGHDNYMLRGGEYDKIRKEIFRYVCSDDTVLEVGCAAGGTYLYFKDYSYTSNYKGVDYCEKFIKSNKKRFPEVEWEVQDARELKEKDESWDCLIYYDAIDSLDGWESALDEAIRVSRYSIIITTWKEQYPERLVRHLVDKGLEVTFYMMTKEELGLSQHYFIIGRNK